MSNITDFLRTSGGGLKPKYQEFLTSGTFTPTQALLDAGGVINVFIVGGGWKSGGEVKMQYNTLTTITGCAVTIGAQGGSSSFIGSSAGGTNITSLGGAFSLTQNLKLGSGWAAEGTDNTAGSGSFGYGAGGGDNVARGIQNGKPNSGQGGFSSGGSGYCLITWGE
jgi:hypothetical protein